MKTLLQIIQEMCKRTGVTSPLTILSSTDDQVVQLLALLNEGLDDLTAKYKWPQKVQEATFISTMMENQGELETIAPGFEEMLPNTFWSLTNRLPLNGSITPADAQTLKIWGRPSALVNFRLINNQLHFIPAQAAGLSYRFEYRSKYMVIDGVTGLRKQYFTTDTDRTVLPDELHLLDLRWRWKMEKGLAYAENFRTFEAKCLSIFAASAPAASLNLGCDNRGAMPGIVVPLGSWNR